MKNYVKKYKTHDVPDGAAHYNADNGCFYNKDKTRIAHSVHDAGEWFDITVTSAALAAIELPEQDLPDWDDAPEWADRLVGIKEFLYWGSAEYYSEVGFYKISGDASKFNHGGLTLGDFELIEMRPIAIEDKEWDGKSFVKAGQECRYAKVGSDNWTNCIVKFSERNCTIIVVSVDGVDKALELPMRFLPIKTAAEIEQEALDKTAFINWVQLSISGIHEDDFNEHEIAACLYEWRLDMPKGEG